MQINFEKIRKFIYHEMNKSPVSLQYSRSHMCRYNLLYLILYTKHALRDSSFKVVELSIFASGLFDVLLRLSNVKYRIHSV